MTRTIHHAHIRKALADQRARDHEGYREVPESDHLDILRPLSRADWIVLIACGVVVAAIAAAGWYFGR